MGQVQSSDPDDADCFRPCLRDKKSNSGKLPPAPRPGKQHYLSPPANQTSGLKHSEKKQRKILSTNKVTSEPKGAETSLQGRLEQQISRKGGGGADGSSSLQGAENKQQVQKLDSHIEEKVMLGLQSKFSSSRKTTIHKNRTSTRITAVSEAMGTRSNWQKEGVSADETHNKSHAGSTDSARSRNVLLNKIEEIKQKYYERQLEIEIYQNQDQYQQELQQKDEKEVIEEKRKEVEPEIESKQNDQVKSVGSVRQKILQKLNKRKQQKPRKVRQSRQSKDNQNSNSNQVTPTEDLQLFSKLGERVSLEDSIKEEVKQQKQLNESVKSVQGKNQNDVSIGERILFSGYSQQQTLHEIRQCDEEQEDYKSKTESKAKASIMSKSKFVSHKFSNRPSLRKQANDSHVEASAVKENRSRVERSRVGREEEVGEEGRGHLSVSGVGRGSKIYVF